MYARSVAESESVVLYLYASVSQHLQQLGQTDPPMVQVNARRYGGLLDRLMSVGCRALRQTCLMVHGEYVAPHRHVYCPSILY